MVSSFGLFKLKSASGIPSPDFWLGFALYGFGFFIWYYVLTRLPLSVAFPIAAGSLVIATQVVGYLFLGETIHLAHAGGVALIAIGIFLIFLQV